MKEEREGEKKLIAAGSSNCHKKKVSCLASAALYTVVRVAGELQERTMFW